MADDRDIPIALRKMWLEDAYSKRMCTKWQYVENLRALLRDSQIEEVPHIKEEIEKEIRELGAEPYPQIDIKDIEAERKKKSEERKRKLAESKKRKQQYEEKYGKNVEITITDRERENEILKELGLEGERLYRNSEGYLVVYTKIMPKDIEKYTIKGVKLR